MLRITLAGSPGGLTLRSLAGLLLKLDDLLSAVVREAAGPGAPAGWMPLALSLDPPAVNLVPEPPLPGAVEAVLGFLDWLHTLPGAGQLPLTLPILEHLQELLKSLDRQGLELTAAWEDRPPVTMGGETGRRLAALTGREPPEAGAWVGRLEMLNLHGEPFKAALYEEGTRVRLALEFPPALLPPMKALLGQRVLLEGYASWADAAHTVLQRVTVQRLQAWDLLPAGREEVVP